MANNDKFRADIKRFIAKSNDGMSKYARAVVLNIDKSVVMKSPVDKGRFIQNWNIGNGLIDSSTSDVQNTNRGNAIAKAAALINSIVINGQTIYVTNALPYAYRLEYEGWSLQAPQGMVRITLAEMNNILKDAAFEVKQ